jgi:hypothetical protein
VSGQNILATPEFEKWKIHLWIHLPSWPILNELHQAGMTRKVKKKKVKKEDCNSSSSDPSEQGIRC